MVSSEVPAELSHDRRRFLGAAGAAALGAGLPAHNQAASMSFWPVRQIKAGVLNVGYAEAGPANGRPVILMHGFPYDIHSYIDVAPLLAAHGYRVIVPYFRGHGTTTFLSASTPRDVDQAAFALDIVSLMDALKIKRAILAGYDWGSRTGDIIAALWPDRVKALVSVAGYLITILAAQKAPLPPEEENDWWYQYYFDTERGVLGLNKYRYEFGLSVWRSNSPTWKFSTETYNQTATAFNNPDYVPVVIGNYRWRQGLYPPEPEYASIERILQTAPAIGVQAITIDGKYDPFTPPGNGASYRDKFTGKYEHRVFPVGHNVPQEAPRAFVRAVIDADHL